MQLKSILAGAACALAVSSAADAAVITTVYEGTVLMGLQIGDVFGTQEGAELPFEAVFVFDTDLGTRNTTATLDQVEGSVPNSPVLSALLSINGVSHEFASQGHGNLFVQGGSHTFHAVNYSTFDGIGLDEVSDIQLGAAAGGVPFSLEAPYDFTNPGGVLTPSFGIGVYDNDAGVDLFYSEGFFTVSRAYTVQSTGAVPEPATWALMILGFGSAGAVLRRRRVLA